MFNRSILSQLEKWADKPERKPLILRGARQVGKTTIVKLFAERFEKFISLNLELMGEREIFEKNLEIKDLISAIHLYKNVPIGGKTLLFIDEIQNSPGAVASLRYFFEESDLHVIAAGSLLETIFNNKSSFPVGRVEYLKVNPCSFYEFLFAAGETSAIEQLEQIPFASFAHGKLLGLFRSFVLTGGMPEAVRIYSEKNDFTALNPVYEGLLTSYLDDVEKYASNNTMVNIIRHSVRSAFLQAGSRIKFEGFGNSNYRSREIGEALRTLEKAMLLQLVYPSANISLPIMPDTKKSPKLQVLDTGLVNYLAGLQFEVFNSDNLDNVYNGKISEHIAGQELLALSNSPLFKLNFWTREEKQSNAEVDFIWRYKDMLIPIEVKSGPAGRLRSVFEFMDRCPHPFAVRIYSGEFSVDKVKTIKGKEFFLINLPFYLINKLESYLNLVT